MLFQNISIEPLYCDALLPISQLRTDKNTSPILLDQPKENLGRGTVIHLLVPVIHKAKKEAQETYDGYPQPQCGRRTQWRADDPDLR
ncbi:hypothetical protein FUT69_01595 [Xylella taiwanensis]|uniref:Uncharacterized protein n=1 Tax=Xylella taiwanensis TaxID=1444770 RepID=Z9JM70_9GAMM|nr:hypothetical protein [Xylella taiwanensis]AXI84174.1 hypothetical protein AB672_09620 [Xylella taiwanensis]EWS78931.1 hypothetical protein AF72_03235 [Xylella taiwanensis]MCD8457292.1 hypothetical protein [Xylella taiwanensis]MCD8459702.1 hypothetical protein [Xylella taiwanensis]MCD8461428.1 hypothetical protein [Xylella taiwanensis]